MRGLIGPRLSGKSSVVLMSTGAIVLVGTVLFAVGCSTGGTGLRDGGPARTESVAKTGAPSSAPSEHTGTSPTSQASGKPAAKVDPIALIKADPKVSSEIKRDLKPCSGKEYPVDVSYGKVTGGPEVDIVVNVLSCADALGRGSFVYRADGDGGSYENVFSDEQPPVYAEIDRGDLILTKPVYGKSDALSYPSGEDLITYRWNGEQFTEQDRVHTDYSSVVDGGTVPAPAVSPKS